MFLAEKILKNKSIILAAFLIAALICVFLQMNVRVNYNMADYLPQNAPSTKSLDVMTREFAQHLPNARVLVPDVTIPEAMAYKERLAGLPGVNMVLWLDDAVNLHKPLALAPEKTVSAWYRNGEALFYLSVETENAASIVSGIREVIGASGAISGNVVDQASAQSAAQQEVKQVIIYFVPLILIILLLTSRSWVEPVLFLASIGVAIIINMGTNIIFKEISFITQAVTPVLQLAVSMDYAIFLLSRFSQYRKEGDNAHDAMKKAMVKAFGTIAGSAATTVFGFAALMLMQFRIGPDMGIILAKGVLLSFISVMLFLPAITLFMYKLMDKTAHRPLIPSFYGFGRSVVRYGLGFVLLVGLLIIPGYLAQQNNQFIYGAAGMDADSAAARDAERIESAFGQSSQMVLLVPRENWGKEIELQRKLAEIPQITSIASYLSAVGPQIPVEFLTEEQLSPFLSENFSRIVLAADMEDESAESFAVVDKVRALASEYFDNYHLVGTSASIRDIKNTVTADNIVVNRAAMLAIGAVLLLVTRSLTLPFILLLTIQSAIWINLAIPYFTGTPLNYIGYLVVSSVQLGATVDYGILFTQHYSDNRKAFGSKKKAAIMSVTETAVPILTPASILAMGGFILNALSTNSIVQELGLMLGRGAALSAAMVLLFLPGLLLLSDAAVQKTTLGFSAKDRKEIE